MLTFSDSVQRSSDSMQGNTFFGSKITTRDKLTTPNLSFLSCSEEHVKKKKKRWGEEIQKSTDKHIHISNMCS